MQNSDFGVSNQSSSSFNNIRVIHKVTLSLDLLSPCVPCFLGDVKSAKEIECSQYKKYCCDFFLSLPFAPFVFTLCYLITFWVYVMHVWTCYEYEGDVTCDWACYVTLEHS